MIFLGKVVLGLEERGEEHVKVTAARTEGGEVR